MKDRKFINASEPCSWLLQEDVVQRIIMPSSWLLGLVPIYEEARSYIEDFYWECFLLPRLHSNEVLCNDEWLDEQLGLRPPRLVKFTKNDFMSAGIRRFLRCERTGHSYTVEGKVVAVHLRDSCSYAKRERVTLDRHCLLNVLNRVPRSVALWRFRSFRYSEQSLGALGLQTRANERFQGKGYFYKRKIFKVAHHIPHHRVRMISGTEIIGNLIVDVNDE